jgi:dTDP-4-dehydrorhamnose 3,5-epimerase
MAAVEPLDLTDVLLIRPRKFADPRGYFVETWRADTYADLGVTADFVQDNESWSARAGTVRGLHYQAPPAAQAKLVRVLRGSIFDVAVDLRRSSPAFGRWCSAVLTAESAEQMFVPRGFAHGFCTLEDDVLVAYKIDSYYAPAAEGGLAWNDADLAIEWPVSGSAAVVSEKDRALPPLAALQSPFA